MDKYEKLYNEALERFKSFKEKYYTKDTNLGDVIFDKNGEMQKDFIGIFPEPKESEDEKIRKELIEFIKWSVDRHFMREDFHQAKRPSEWIAYLEKQKYDRMQPIYDSIDSFESALDKAWKAYNDSGARTVDGCEDDYVECAHAKGFREGYLFGLEKQKEQKPWKVGANAYFTPEQKQEWSEEDERIIDTIVSVLGQYIDYKAVSGTGSGYATPRYSKEIDWLNCLRTTNQGWNEKDEEMRNLIAAIFEVNHPDGFFKANELGTTDMRGVHTEEIISFLKSLRPSWKPSEEQMEALAYAIQVLAPRAAKASEELENLREQLKKLM